METFMTIIKAGGLTYLIIRAFYKRNKRKSDEVRKLQVIADLLEWVEYCENNSIEMSPKMRKEWKKYTEIIKNH
jgi:hypothetical protein